jgi:hypothetical protein
VDAEHNNVESAESLELRTLETEILASVFWRLPGPQTVSATEPESAPIDPIHTDASPTWPPNPLTLRSRPRFEEALAALEADKLVRVERSADSWRISITDGGMLELGRRRPGIAHGEFKVVNHLLTGVVAQMTQLVHRTAAQEERGRRAADAAERAQQVSEATLVRVEASAAEFKAYVDAAELRLKTLIESINDQQSQLRDEIAQVEPKIGAAERAFYVQVIPIFALVVSAFALVITGAQSAAPSSNATIYQTITTADEFWNTFWTVTARLAPMGALFLVLVLATLFATIRLRRR